MPVPRDCARDQEIEKRGFHLRGRITCKAVREKSTVSRSGVARPGQSYPADEGLSDRFVVSALTRQARSTGTARNVWISLWGKSVSVCSKKMKKHMKLNHWKLNYENATN